MLTERALIDVGLVEIYPTVPRPTTVEPICVARYNVLTRFTRFAVLTNPLKLAVDTNPPSAGILERYPEVPKPTTVDPSCVAK